MVIANILTRLETKTLIDECINDYLTDVYDIEYTARGLYICEAFNEQGIDRRDVTLAIQRKSAIVLLETATQLVHGIQLTFMVKICTVSVTV